MTASVLYDEPGPVTRRRLRIASIVSLALLAAGLAWVVYRLWDAGQLDGERWEVFTEGDTLGYLRAGLLITLRLGVFAIVLATALGLVLALGRVAEPVLEIAAHRQRCRLDDRARVRERLVAADRVLAVGPAEREREPGARGRERLEPHCGQHLRRAGVPRIRDRENARTLVQRTKHRRPLGL